MNVVWKRPDGYHGASPFDYEVVEVGTHSKIWLHRRDTQNYPFRVSGGWQDEGMTVELNQLVNLLNKPMQDWIVYLHNRMNNSQCDNPSEFLDRLEGSLERFTVCLKGDQWELSIMNAVLSELKTKISQCKKEFIGSV